MIVSKTPLRLTLGGGGTDLPSYSSTNIPHINLIVNASKEQRVKITTLNKDILYLAIMLTTSFNILCCNSVHNFELLSVLY